jgi:hypothetical protein
MMPPALPARWSAAPIARLLAALLLSCAAHPVHAARVAGVSPSGEVAEVRQVVVRFDAGVAGFGDPRQPAPFKLVCNGATPPGDARWLDERRWAYDLREPLAAGQRCKLTAEPALALEGANEFAFATGAPVVVSVQPYPGSRIEEDQHFLLLLNGEVDPASVRRSVWCEVEGLGERIAVRLVEGHAKTRLLAQRRRGSDARRNLLLACERAFAPEAAVRLVWSAGVTSPTGLVSRVERRWSWKVRPRLLAEFSCERENAQSPCLPLRPMTLRFNAPVPRALALAAQLVPAVGRPATATAPGAPIAARADDDDKGATLTEVRFPAPLPENTRFRLTLPAALADDAGRPLGNAASFPLEVATGAWPPLAKFAGAPFGIVEFDARSPDAPALLPLTLRHVQADLAGASTAGQVAVKRIDAAAGDAALLAWIARVQRWHEGQLAAREAGLPQDQWFETVAETDSRGRARHVRRERFVPAREHALLAREDGVQRAALPQLRNTVPRATEVLGVPLPAKGYHVVEVESRVLGDALLGRRAPMFVRSGVLVTNLAVQFKRGHSSSLVWVSTLDRARPVAGARVAVNDCNGRPLWSGSTGADGIAHIERGLGDPAGEGPGPGGAPCATPDGHFVTARHGDDLAFVFGRWSRGIEPWRFNLPTAGDDGDTGPGPARRAHTVFDRTLLRVGDTVSMKHFVREATERGLALPAADTLPDTVVITHLGSGNETTLPLAWPRGARASESRWPIPQTAALGLYDVTLKRGDRRWPSGRLRVEAFRVPLVDARLQGPPGVQIAPKEVAFSAQLAALAGGPMPDRALTLSALLRPAAPGFVGQPEFVDFVFGGPAREGRDAVEAGGGAELSAPDGARLVARALPGRTDAAGGARFVVPGLPPIDRVADLVTELSFTDPNGEVQTVSRSVRVWPSAVVVGLRLPGWAARRGDARLTALVLDTDGQPLAGREVELVGRAVQTLSTRQRIVGGFYAYDNKRSVRDLGRLCGGKSDAQGRVHCDIQLRETGEVELVARARDDAGRVSEAGASLWVEGAREDQRWWFAQDNDDRIDVLPEKRELAPGATARLQVRMPYRQATALVTVEREGVIDARVVTLSGRAPVVELPIPSAARGGRSWAPNVHVGVFVQRGRLRDAPWWSIFTWGWRDPADWWRAFRYEGRDWRAPGALADLAKPGFKFGVASLTVGLAEQRLDVKVTPDKAQYGVRETVKTVVRVSQGGKPLAGAEVAFAAVDEGLLALAGNESWDLLEGLWRPRPWSVETATALGEVIGRRHHGRKALPPGGGGGRNPTRELFDTLLLWKGTLALDANGEARIDVPLNDSLTSFRLVAIADAGADRFGTGSASVRVTQDLQLLAGLAPLVREGDRFDAGFTLRNTTARTMNVRATLAGAAGGRALAQTLAPQALTLAPGAAAELKWTVDVPEGVTRIDWEAAAEETGGAAGGAGPLGRDRVKIAQAVASPVPVRAWQGAVLPLEARVSLPAALPEGALPGRGGLQVTLQPSLAGALPGLRRFFETYPYTCMEQKASRAIALRDEKLWATLRGELAGHLDVDGLAAYFPPAPGSGPVGSDRLTAYLVATAHEAGLAWPDAERERMLRALTDFVEGRLERRFPAPRADLDVRKLAALEALARHGRVEGRMLGSIAFTPAAWPTSALLDAWSLYERVPALPDRAARLAELQRLLRGRLAEGGSTLKFSTEADDDWWWLMESADGNAARLLLAATASPAWKDDLPRILNGSLARQRGGAWRTTTANLWGVLALAKFAKAFESQPIAGQSTLRAAPVARTHDWQAAPAGASLALPWPADGAPFVAEHQGGGRPWLAVQALAAVPLKAPLFAGYRITRSVSTVGSAGAADAAGSAGAAAARPPAAWRRGDVMRVRLEVEALADMSWVVISDALPAGAAVLGGGLGRDSTIGTLGERRESRAGRAWLAYEERAADAWRAYYAWMPRGRHVIEYSVRLSGSGRFGLPPTRVEAMYAPDSFAELPLAPLEVQP